MQPFTRLQGVVAALPLADIDTDKIIPGRFLKTVKRTGLGVHLFDSLRYLPDGSERTDFVLNQTPNRSASILIAGENFGCGSSREHALWALLDFGIRCIIAPSFADIFAGNAVKNGLLLVQLQPDACAVLASHDCLTVDLNDQSIYGIDERVFSFEIGASVKRTLLEGLDDISETLVYAENITGYEQTFRD